MNTIDLIVFRNSLIPPVRNINDIRWFILDLRYMWNNLIFDILVNSPAFLIILISRPKFILFKPVVGIHFSLMNWPKYFATILDSISNFAPYR